LIRPITLTGYSSENLTGGALRATIGALSGWLASGTIAAPSFTTMPLHDASKAHALLEARGVKGRVLLVPAL
jgi:NADPH2:quinone reductase